jgi:small subunit ribosomal protein S2
MAETNFNINTEEMEKAGLQFGHKTSRIHPKMMPFLSGVRNTIHIIDLEKSAEKLKEALKFIQKTISEDKILLIVGTKIQVKGLVKNTAEELGLPYVNERWLGGTFTNFDIIKKRLEHFKDLEQKKASGELEKYTKKERLLIDKKLKDLAIKFGGIKNLEKLPEVIFVLDIKKDILAVNEAKAKRIKTVGISDTNINPNLVDYPIPANDDAVSSVKYILEKVKEAIIQAKAK